MSFDYLKKQLKENGFSGLYIPGGCQCSFYDFMPCQEWHPDSEIKECIPGYCHKEYYKDKHASKHNQLYFISGEKNIKTIKRIVIKKKKIPVEQGLLF